MEVAGKTILITGANTGIGRTTALALARQGATLVLAGRSEARHAGVLSELSACGTSATFLPLDLGNLASVRACAQRFLASGAPLHMLVNNAGLAGARGQTGDGFELAFGVNHLGPFLLTELLLERIKASAPSRIVNVSSVGHYRAKPLDWDALRRPTSSVTGLPEYNTSKLCNVLHAKELATRLAGSDVTTYSLHPGTIASDIWREVPWGLRHLMRLAMRSTEQGAATTLHCATSDEAGAETGLYYEDCRPKPPSAFAMDAALGITLRTRSEAWVN